MTGVRPDTALAADAGVGLGTRGAIAVDRQMRTNLPDVYAAGDCVHTYHPLLERPVYLPLGSTAHRQGRVAGANAVGGRAVFAGSLGTSASASGDPVYQLVDADQAHDGGVFFRNSPRWADGSRTIGLGLYCGESGQLVLAPLVIESPSADRSGVPAARRADPFCR